MYSGKKGSSDALQWIFARFASISYEYLRCRPLVTRFVEFTVQRGNLWRPVSLCTATNPRGTLFIIRSPLSFFVNADRDVCAVRKRLSEVKARRNGVINYEFCVLITIRYSNSLFLTSASLKVYVLNFILCSHNSSNKFYLVLHNKDLSAVLRSSKYSANSLSLEKTKMLQTAYKGVIYDVTNIYVCVKD